MEPLEIALSEVTILKWDLSAERVIRTGDMHEVRTPDVRTRELAKKRLENIYASSQFPSVKSAAGSALGYL